MSNHPTEALVPEWTMGDRLWKALQVAGISHQAMADYLGVSRNTLTNYTRGRTKADKRTLMLWAMRTGVPLEWLRTGQVSPQPGGRLTVSYRDSRRSVAA